ncbi:MAG: hypothetical protein JWR21_2849 [Herminiimonas sp.]|nr:hypothetical protein [Herminiimonas sp.]
MCRHPSATPDLTASSFWGKNPHSSKWCDRTVQEHEGKVDGRIQTHTMGPSLTPRGSGSTANHLMS